MESSRKLVILLVAGVIVAFGAVALRSRIASQPAAPEAQLVRVVIAKNDIAPGTLVQAGSDLMWGPPPENTQGVAVIQEGSTSLEAFNGAVARKQLKAGEAIDQSALMKSGEGGFMSAVLEPGMRAVSIAVTATSGNAGFISPGDRVDLIVTHRIKFSTGVSGNAGAEEESVVSETFVQDVRVLAVDQMLDNPENKAILAKTVTVEVSDRQAEQVAVATEMGKISIALRSLTNPQKTEDAASTVTPAVTDLYGNYTRDSDVSQLLGGSVSPRMRVIRGDQVENLEFIK